MELWQAGFFGRKVAASGGKVGVGILCVRGAGGGRPGGMQEEAGRRRLAAEQCLSSHRFREVRVFVRYRRRQVAG